MKRIAGYFITILCLLSYSLILSSKTSQAELTVQEPVFDRSGGLYTEEFNLTISITDDTSNMILYTLDGSIPELDGPTVHAYTKPIRIGYEASREEFSRYFCGTVIRARAFTPDGSGSKTVTATYFVAPDIYKRYQLPFVTVTTDPDNLYDRSTGIMAAGNTQKRGKEWERPIHFEYFDEDGKQQISIDAGMRLHGGASRDWAIKSLRIYARSEYDEIDQLEYDFFSDSPVPALVKNGKNAGKPITKFKRLILRSGGNEGTAGDGTMFRDALSHALMAGTTLDTQAYSPAIAFLNGEYYGIVNIRERQDEEYIEDHYKAKEEDVVIYEFSYGREGEQRPVISEGEDTDLDFYNNMLDFIRNNDLSVPENYEQMNEWLDIENFVDYQIINIYGANRDWPGNNCKAWRVRTEYNPDAPYGLDGRLRWLLYDTDFNFGLYMPDAYNMNSLSEALRIGGTEWPTQDGATLLLRKLLENEDFKTYFCQRFLDLINTEYDAEHAYSLIDALASDYEVSIQEYREKYHLWGDWHSNVETVKNFISKRGSICKFHLAERFDLGKMLFLSINTGADELTFGGHVEVNTVKVSASSVGIKDGIWRRSYYEGLPTMLTAVPGEGYEFVAWSGATDSKDTSIDASVLFMGTGEVTLTPIFRAIEKAPDKSNNDSKATDTASDNGTAADTEENAEDKKGSVKETGTADGKSDKEDTAGKTAVVTGITVFVSALAALGAYIIIRNKKRKRDM